jgi:hypothetical protein
MNDSSINQAPLMQRHIISVIVKRLLLGRERDAIQLNDGSVELRSGAGGAIGVAAR